MIRHLVRSAKRRLAGFASESDGASAVEFALVFPLAFFLIASSFELGMLMFNQAAIESAVREAARYGLTGQGTEDGARGSDPGYRRQVYLRARPIAKTSRSRAEVYPTSSRMWTSSEPLWISRTFNGSGIAARPIPI